MVMNLTNDLLSSGCFVGETKSTKGGFVPLGINWIYSFPCSRWRLRIFFCKLDIGNWCGSYQRICQIFRRLHCRGCVKATTLRTGDISSFFHVLTCHNCTLIEVDCTRKSLVVFYCLVNKAMRLTSLNVI